MLKVIKNRYFYLASGIILILIPIALKTTDLIHQYKEEKGKIYKLTIKQNYYGSNFLSMKVEVYKMEKITKPWRAFKDKGMILEKDINNPQESFLNLSAGYYELRFHALQGFQRDEEGFTGLGSLAPQVEFIAPYVIPLYSNKTIEVKIEPRI